MRNRLAALALLAATPAGAAEMEHHHGQMHHDGEAHHHGDAPVRRAPIEIAINPEARVSVTLGAPMPKHQPCGRPIAIPVSIANDSFITARLEARLAGNVPKDVRLDFRPEPLSGKAQDWRALTLVLGEPGLKDITISFKAHGDIPDLGGRDRVHFLIGCEPRG